MRESFESKVDNKKGNSLSPSTNRQSYDPRQGDSNRRDAPDTRED